MSHDTHAGGGRTRVPDPVAERSESVILDSITEGVFTVDERWRITSFNSAEKITGIPRDRAMGRACKDIFRASICETECSLRRTIETGAPTIGKRIAIIDGRGTRRTISICTAILRDERGAPSSAESKRSAM